MSAKDVHAAYVGGRRRAESTSTVRLRFAVRQITRRRDVLDQVELAQLKAFRDELRDRGVGPAHMASR